jgi:hypothetical protein
MYSFNLNSDTSQTEWCLELKIKEHVLISHPLKLSALMLCISYTMHMCMDPWKPLWLYYILHTTANEWTPWRTTILNSSTNTTWLWRKKHIWKISPIWTNLWHTTWACMHLIPYCQASSRNLTLVPSGSVHSLHHPLLIIYWYFHQIP